MANIKRVPSIPVERKDQLNTAKEPTAQFAKTRDEWYRTNTVVSPANLLLLETDTRKMKVSDGVHTYSDLDYYIDAVVSDELYNYLLNANEIGGVILLDSTRHIPEEYLPPIHTGKVKIASTYSEMVSKGNDPTTGSKYKAGPVIVLNASDDPSGTVLAGGGFYAWADELSPEPAWIKVAEFAEPEITLTEYFKLSGDNHHRIGSIEDDVLNTSLPYNTQYLKFSYADKQLLVDLANAPSPVTYEAVEAIHAVMYPHAILCRPIDLAALGMIYSLPV